MTTELPEGWTPKDSLDLARDPEAFALWSHLIAQATWTLRDLRAQPWHPKEGDTAWRACAPSG